MGISSKLSSNLKMAPPTSLGQIRDHVSQSGVVARCLDNKKNLNFKRECYLISILVYQNVFAIILEE
jgi:hypothetical protein